MDDFMCEDEDVTERAGNCLAGVTKLDVDGNFIFDDGKDFYSRMVTKFTPDLCSEHPESKLRALHDLSSQQWLIILIVYHMSEMQNDPNKNPWTCKRCKTISMDMVYAEATKFNRDVVAQSGRSFQGKPRKRQKVWMLDLDDWAYSSFEDSWKGLLDKYILAPWLPVYRNIDPKSVEPINAMRGQPEKVVIDSAGYTSDPSPLGHRDQVIRGLTAGTMAVIRNLYDAFQAQREGPFGPNPFAKLPPEYLKLVDDVEP